jgi:hypothetical protein
MASSVIRKYQPNKYTGLWFTAFMWGVIFTHNQVFKNNCLICFSFITSVQLIELFDGKGIRLFIVQAES